MTRKPSRKRRRKHTQPQWKVTVLWIFLAISMLTTTTLMYHYYFPAQLSYTFHSKWTHQDYTCKGYPNGFKTDYYCCQHKSFNIITDLNTSDPEKDFNWTVNFYCYKIESHNMKQK